jgi:hypothetical protein
MLRVMCREMRGVWGAATPEVDTGAIQAAKHLHLVPEGDETPSLLGLAQDAGTLT